MRLDQDTVNLLEIHGFSVIADGFDQRRETEIADSTQNAFRGAHNELEGFFGEGVMAEAGTIKLVENELVGLIGIEFWNDDGISDPGFDIFVDGKANLVEQRRLSNEDDVVVFWEIFEEKAEFSQANNRHQMGIVNNGNEHFSEVIESESFLDEAFFTSVIAAVKVDLKGLAKNAQGIGVGMESAGDGRRNQSLGIVIFEGFLNGGFTGAGFAHE